MSEVFFEDAFEALVDLEDSGCVSKRELDAIRSGLEHAVHRIKGSTAELAALRARCADLELMLRAQLAASWDEDQAHFVKSHHEWDLWTPGYRPIIDQTIALEDDGTGIPLLTDAARKALSPSTEQPKDPQ